MAKPFNIALALSFTCLFLMLCVALAQHPSSDVTAAIGEDTDEPADTGSKRNVSSQRAASWHARERAHTHHKKRNKQKTVNVPHARTRSYLQYYAGFTTR